jgi:cytochrome c553
MRARGLRQPAFAILASFMGACSGVAAEDKTSHASKGDRALGEYLSSECVTCHQVSGKHAGGIPSIIAWPEDQFIAMLEAFKRRERDNQVMQTLASRLSTEEIEALAAYFGSLPAPPAPN